jgi:hypothetical protein
MTDSLSGITDVASATKAVPKLTELNNQLDALKSQMDKLPADGKARIAELIKTNLGKLEDQFAKLLWVPGVGDKIKPLVGETLNKMASLGGLPTPQMPQLSSDLAGLVSTVTDVLSDVRDTASAEAALPKLQNLNENLDGMKSMMDKLPEAGKSTIAALVKAALVKLREAADKVTTITGGVGEKIKPIVTAILDKLNTFAA